MAHSGILESQSIRRFAISSGCACDSNPILATHRAVRCASSTDCHGEHSLGSIALGGASPHPHPVTIVFLGTRSPWRQQKWLADRSVRAAAPGVVRRRAVASAGDRMDRLGMTYIVSAAATTRPRRYVRPVAFSVVRSCRRSRAVRGASARPRRRAARRRAPVDRNAPE